MLRLLLRPTYVAIFALLIGVLLTSFNIVQLRILQNQHYRSLEQEKLPSERSEVQQDDRRPVAWIKGDRMESGYLSEVIRVFDRLGYKVLKGDQPHDIKFDVLWSHEYPFTKKEFKSHLDTIKPYQKWNHMPGSGYYTSKVSLATSDISQGIPKAFQIPRRKEELLDYAKQHPEMMWVQKNNEHRGIKIRKLNELDLDQENSFVQQYIDNPLLIDGRKFDLGVYTVVTSVSPLRVYVFDGDVLLRFCAKPYEPFNAEDVDQYVVGDDYTPIWEMDSLKKYYVDERMTFKETLNAHVRSLGKDPATIWDSVKETIAEVFKAQQENMIASSKRFSDQRSFFELSRFDFLLDENLNVFLMEANMSPNLSSGHFAANRLLYEQVLVNLLSLVGVATHLHGQTRQDNFRDKPTRQTEVSDRDINVYAEDCAIEGAPCYGKEGCMKQLKCQLCGHCLSYQQKTILRSAYEEHVSRRNMRRVLPFAVHRPEHAALKFSTADRLLILWFDAKCRQDVTWCH